MSESSSEPRPVVPENSQATPPDAGTVFTKIYDGLPRCLEPQVCDILRSTLFADGKKRWAAALESIRARVAADD